MVISESAFLLLEPENKRKNLCTLIVYASLYALESLEHDLETPNKLTLYWNVSYCKVVKVIIIGAF